MQILTQVALEPTGNVRSIAWHANSNLVALHNVSASTVDLLQPDRAQVCNMDNYACASQVAASHDLLRCSGTSAWWSTQHPDLTDVCLALSGHLLAILLYC